MANVDFGVSTMKDNALKQEEYKSYEYMYWYEKGYLECNDFSEVLIKVGYNKEN